MTQLITQETMARAKNLMEITGSMANFSMYKLQGHDEVIVRSKGGPSKYQIKTKPQFEKVRRNNNEWKACTNMTGQIRQAYYYLKNLEDYPASGSLNALCKQIQKLDTESEHGKRNILLSAHKEMLVGFTLSRKQVFESVVRVPVTANIDRNTGIATIDIPALNTDLYLYNFRKLPYYRIVAMFSSLTDIVYADNQYIQYYESSESFFSQKTGWFESEWLPTLGTQAGMNITLRYPMDIDPIPTHITLMLSIGIEFGKPGAANSIEPVKYAGSGKILKVC